MNMIPNRTPWIELVLNIIVVFLNLSARTPPNAIIRIRGTVIAMRIIPNELAEPKSEMTNHVVVIKNMVKPIIAKKLPTNRNIMDDFEIMIVAVPYKPSSHVYYRTNHNS